MTKRVDDWSMIVGQWIVTELMLGSNVGFIFYRRVIYFVNHLSSFVFSFVEVGSVGFMVVEF